VKKVLTWLDRLENTRSSRFKVLKKKSAELVSKTKDLDFGFPASLHRPSRPPETLYNQ